MRKSIFEIENRIDINKEFMKFVDTLSESGTLWYDGNSMSLFAFLNRKVFNLWKYRDTFIDLAEYLEHIGINTNVLEGKQKINENTFLNFLELLLNLMLVVKKTIGMNNINFFSIKVENIIEHNIPIILEKMNYRIHKELDKIYIRKRDADVDSILEIVPEDIANLLLEYNDARNNCLENKKTILKKIDLFIERRKKDYKSYNASTYESIQTIVNKMGINHPITDEPYKSFDSRKLMDWYDKCFKLMIHLIRTENIIEINKERDSLMCK